MGYGTATFYANHWAACIGNYQLATILGVVEFISVKIAESAEMCGRQKYFTSMLICFRQNMMLTLGPLHLGKQFTLLNSL